MSDGERDVLDAVLSLEFRGASALALQASAIRGVRSSCGCGCGSIYLDVDRSLAEPTNDVSIEIPVTATFPVRRGHEIESHGGQLTVRVREGWLHEIDVTSVGDDPPKMPSPDDLSFYPVPRGATTDFGTDGDSANIASATLGDTLIVLGSKLIDFVFGR